MDRPAGRSSISNAYHSNVDETCPISTSVSKGISCHVLICIVEAENIKVYLRIRPFIEREDNSLIEPSIVSRRVASVIQVSDPGTHADGLHGTTVRLSNNRSPSAQYLSSDSCESFTFDAVGGPDIGQEHVFAIVAKNITENCLQGYNGTIFA